MVTKQKLWRGGNFYCPLFFSQIFDCQFPASEMATRMATQMVICMATPMATRTATSGQRPFPDRRGYAGEYAGE
jgi:hypothetical protein